MANMKEIIIPPEKHSRTSGYVREDQDPPLIGTVCATPLCMCKYKKIQTELQMRLLSQRHYLRSGHVKYKDGGGSAGSGNERGYGSFAIGISPFLLFNKTPRTRIRARSRPPVAPVDTYIPREQEQAFPGTVSRRLFLSLSPPAPLSPSLTDGNRFLIASPSGGLLNAEWRTWCKRAPPADFAKRIVSTKPSPSIQRALLPKYSARVTIALTFSFVRIWRRANSHRD